MDKEKRTQGKRATTRRSFLTGLAATTGFAIVPQGVLGRQGHVAPSEKTVLACIGMGGQGHVNLFNLLQFDELQVAAVCDVNDKGGGYISWYWMQGKEQKLGGCEPARRLVNEYYAKQKNVAKYRGCQAYSDYRELFEQEDIDAVMVATPDHTHAAITMAAIKRGQHVYCEKPLAYSVREVRQVTEAARRMGVATQLGNQGQATQEARIVQEFMLDGAIGPVREVHVTVGAPFWEAPVWAGRLPETPPVPAGLNWDLWLGPAPVRPYHPAYHPWRWRDWQDFGTGPLGDMGCHRLSTVFKALKLKYPISVEATCTEIGPEIHPRRFEVCWEFPERDGMPPVTLTWRGGGLQPPRPEQLEAGRRVQGDMYIGDKGTLMGNRLIPESKMKTYGQPPKVFARSPGHYREWVDACRGGPPAGSDFVRHGGPLSETPLLGNVAMRVGRKLKWDGPNMRFTNDCMANRLLHRAYRAGWTL